MFVSQSQYTTDLTTVIKTIMAAETYELEPKVPVNEKIMEKSNSNDVTVGEVIEISEVGSFRHQ